MIPLVLVAHGSRDPRAGAATRALARAVVAVRPWADVRAAYLEHSTPSLGSVLTEVSAGGHRAAVLVPLLLTSAYHHRVDIPTVLAGLRAAGLPLTMHRARVLGPPPAGPVDDELLAALRRRLVELDVRFDALVLAAAGSRAPAARDAVAAMATALGDHLGVPCTPGYASAATPTVATAVAGLRARNARRVVIASYFLAPGVLRDRALRSGFSAGATAASAPLGDDEELAHLVLARADACLSRGRGWPAATRGTVVRGTRRIASL